MYPNRIHLRAAALLLALAEPRALAVEAAAAPNPLLESWSGPYGSVPPFGRVRVEDFRAAFDVAMERSRLEAAAIASSPVPPTFENTIAALEDQGRAFTRVAEVYGAWSNVMSSPEFEALERDMEPRLAAFYAETTQNEALFRRVAAVHESAAKATWTPEQRRLVELYYRDFVNGGAQLDAAGKRRIAAIDERLAALYASFSGNVRHDERRCTLLETEADLAGLPEPARAAAVTAATTCGGKSQWAIANTRSSVATFLSHSDRRDLREKVWRNYDERGDHGNAHDNNAIVTELLGLRAERAKLLGYATHAHLMLETTMAKTPERAVAILESLWTPAVARVREELAAMQALADRSGERARIAPWDYRYYGEKVRKATYDVDENEVKEYLQLETLREGMFHVAGELFGLDFAPATDVPVYHPDVRVFEVKDRATGRHAGFWYFDPYARPGKYNGGLTDIIRIQERFRGEVAAIILNSTPFAKPGPGEPALLGWRDAQTLFHEFGHALHNFRSNVSYPALAGSRVVKDYGEFPPQLLEKWLATPQVLDRFARHHRTGKTIPPELVAKLTRAATFNQGFYTVDYLTSALVEMKMHLALEQPIDPDAFERDTLKRLGAPEEVGMRYRMPHFTHAFASEGYSAGYYMYLWSDMHAADAFEAFSETGNAFDSTVAARLRAHVFSVGNAVDPFEGYRAFRGRDATIDALMRLRGFAVAAGPALTKDDRALHLSQRMLTELVTANGVPGMGAAVWRDGRIVWTGSAGYRDLEKGLRVDADTIFRLASVSKLFTATAAARLTQDAMLDVDAPVNRILPYLSSKWPPLTVRQLAAHTSGLPHYQDVDEGRGGKHYVSVHEAVGVFKDRDLLFLPGTKYGYSSWGYTLLSAVVEQKAGIPFLDYVSTSVTRGLAIGADATGSGNPNASKAYAFVDAKALPAPAHDFSYTWGGGGLGATPQSLAEFGGRMLGGKIVSPATFGWMLAPARLPDGSDVKDEDYAVGFGWRSGADFDGERIAHHAGVTIGARSTLVLWPDQSAAVSLLSNALWVSSIEQSAMMLAAPFKPAPAGLVRQTCPLSTTRYTGMFGDKPIGGTLRFAMEDGVCVGEMGLGNALGDYLNGFLQRDAKTLRIIGLDELGGLSRAALITPIGVFDLRARSDAKYDSPLTGTRPVSLTFATN